MAKAKFLKYVSSGGREFEFSMREDGAQFEREYCFNGYSNAWSKWYPCSNRVIFSDANIVEKCRYRLPDNEYLGKPAFYQIDIKFNNCKLAVVHYSEHKYSDNNGAIEIFFGLDEDGNFAMDVK
jgi:hypothetical protein